MESGRVERQAQETAVLLRPSGDLSADTCWELRQELADAFAGGFRSVIVDLAEVERTDAAALRVLVGARAFLRARGGVLLVTSVRPEVLSLIRVHELTELLEVPPAVSLEAGGVRPVTRLHTSRRGANPALTGAPRRLGHVTSQASRGA